MGTRRWTWLGLVTLGLAAGVAVHRMWMRQLSHLTGDAEWMWSTDALERIHPEAGLFITRFALEQPAAGALLKVCGDREYVAYLNGTVVGCGWSRPGFRLDLYDVGHLLRVGDNTLAIEARSPSPVGGVLVALDIDGLGSNVVTSGNSFVFRRSFDLSPPQPGEPRAPVRWGRPPRFPWAYPTAVSKPQTLDEVSTEEPLRWPVEALSRPPRGGWVLTVQPPIFGYLWLEFDSDEAALEWTDPLPVLHPEPVARTQAQPVVRLRGQRRWLDVEAKTIGQVWVFGGRSLRAIELWPVPQELSSTAPGVVVGKSGLVPRTRWSSHIPPG